MRGKLVLLKYLFVCAYALSLASCEIYQEVKVKRVEDIDLNELTNSNVSAVLHVGLENPNPYKITLYESDLELRIDGNVAGTLTLAEPVVLSPKSSQVYDVKVFTNITDVEGLLGNALALMFKDEIELQASGYVQAKGLGIKKMVPLSFTKPISRKAFKLN